MGDEPNGSWVRGRFPTGAWAAFATALLAAACAPARLGAPGAEWHGSPNHNERRPDYVILHHTGEGSAGEALAWLTAPWSEVSAHYVVGRDGRVYQLVDERHRAWHAGDARWGGLTDLNSASIGIELDNDGSEPYPPVQIEALLALLADVTARHKIPPTHVLGHGDVAPRRKVDPNAQFPWRELALKGFGPWCELEPVPPAPGPELVQPLLPDPLLALQAFGYDTTDPGAAIAAFKRHFRPGDASTELTRADQALLACLLGAPL